MFKRISEAYDVLSDGQCPWPACGGGGGPRLASLSPWHCGAVPLPAASLSRLCNNIGATADTATCASLPLLHPLSQHPPPIPSLLPPIQPCSTLQTPNAQSTTATERTASGAAQQPGVEGLPTCSSATRPSSSVKCVCRSGSGDVHKCAPCLLARGPGTLRLHAAGADVVRSGCALCSFASHRCLATMSSPAVSAAALALAATAALAAAAVVSALAAALAAGTCSAIPLMTATALEVRHPVTAPPSQLHLSANLTGLMALSSTLP